MASLNASPIDIPENDITLFNNDIDYESHANFKEVNAKNNNYFDDLDPMDEDELLVPSKLNRVPRTAVFRPLFVYRQENEKQQLIADRRSGRASDGKNSHHQKAHGNSRNNRQHRTKQHYEY